MAGAEGHVPQMVYVSLTLKAVNGKPLAFDVCLRGHKQHAARERSGSQGLAPIKFYSVVAWVQQSSKEVSIPERAKSDSAGL